MKTYKVSLQDLKDKIESEGLDYTLVHYYGIENLEGLSSYLMKHVTKYLEHREAIVDFLEIEA